MNLKTHRISVLIAAAGLLIGFPVLKPPRIRTRLTLIALSRIPV
jgi:hypothetical protein